MQAGERGEALACPIGRWHAHLEAQPVSGIVSGVVLHAWPSVRYGGAGLAYRKEPEDGSSRVVGREWGLQDIGGRAHSIGRPLCR